MLYEVITGAAAGTGRDGYLSIILHSGYSLPPAPTGGGLSLFEKPAGFSVPQLNAVDNFKPGLVGNKLYNLN